MKIVVFGATGGTGQATVTQALEQGHEVTAVVRHEDALQQRSGLRLVVVPDLDQVDLVEQAVKDQDVVISALGSNEKGPVTVCTDGVRSIISAMSRQEVRRLIVVSAYGAGETHDRSPYSLVTWAMIGDKMRDKESMERLVRASGLDWTIVRPSILRNKPKTGQYHTGTDLKIGLTSAVPRADLADFLLREATTPSYIHQLPRIAA